MARAYYMNSLKAWQRALNAEITQGAARLGRMHEMGHPDAGDQLRLVSLRQRMLAMVNEEIAAVPHPKGQG